MGVSLILHLLPLGDITLRNLPVTGLDLHFRLWRKLWLRSVKPSRATVHRTVAFDWFESVPLYMQKSRYPNGYLLFGE